MRKREIELRARALERAEREQRILKDALIVLNYFNGNISKAAEFIGCNRTTLYRILSKQSEIKH